MLNVAVVSAIAVHLVTVAAVAEDISRHSRVVARLNMAKVMTVNAAGNVEILAAAAEVVAASARAKLWWRRVI